jgi:hypothetical protein
MDEVALDYSTDKSHTHYYNFVYNTLLCVLFNNKIEENIVFSEFKMLFWDRLTH